MAFGIGAIATIGLALRAEHGRPRVLRPARRSRRPVA
jgi:hypothetical protein